MLRRPKYSKIEVAAPKEEDDDEHDVLETCRELKIKINT
jgi:hypothetical protein